MTSGNTRLQKRFHITTFHFTSLAFLRTAREGNIFTGVCLSTIGLMDTGSLLGLVTARSVRILLECFLVETKSLRFPAILFEEHQSIEDGEIPYT